MPAGEVPVEVSKTPTVTVDRYVDIGSPLCQAKVVQPAAVVGAPTRSPLATAVSPCGTATRKS